MIYAHIKKFDWFPFSHDIQTRVFSKFTLLHAWWRGIGYAIVLLNNSFNYISISKIY